MDKDVFVFVFGILVAGIMIGYGLGGLDFSLDQETTDEICQKLAFYEGNYTNETIESITSEVKKGELHCITPSFDHTQKIKFKSNTE